MPIDDLKTQKVREARRYRDEFYDRHAETLRSYQQLLVEQVRFYEKILLIDGGVMATSLTLIGYLLQVSSQHALPHILFHTLVIPAWILLLAAGYCCLRQILELQVISLHAIKVINKNSGDLLLQDLDILTKEIEHFNVDEKSTAASENLRERIRQEKEKGAVINLEAEISQYTRARWGRAAFACTLLGVLAMCVFSVLSVPLR